MTSPTLTTPPVPAMASGKPSGGLLRATVNAAKTLVRQDYDGGRTTWFFYCPACDALHTYSNRMSGGGPGWDYDGNVESPTFSPSLRYLDATRCHLFVRAGVIEFCGDCPHSMAGQRTPLPPIPQDDLDWLVPA